MFRSIHKSPTLLLNERSRKLEAEGKTIYKFGFGESSFLPPVSVREALAGAVNRKEYAPVKGLPELCERIATFHTETDGYPITPQQVYIAPGSKILLHNAMGVFEPGIVFVPEPAWVSYAPQARLLHHQAIPIKTTFESRWRVTPEALEDVLRPYNDQNINKIVVLNYPGNPDGLSYTRTELEALTTILRKHGVWVISDEIYGLLHHEGGHQSIASYYPERTITTTGLSKWCGAGGWRFGAAIVPQDAPTRFVDAFLGLASETYSSAATPMQVAACTAYQLTDDIKIYLNNQRTILKTIGKWVYHTLAQAGIAVHPPTGAFYMLLDFRPYQEQLAKRGITTDQALCEALLIETGVVLLPGCAFGTAPENLLARFAYVTFDGDNAIKLLANGANENAMMNAVCTHLMHGTTILSDWVQALG